MNTGCLVCLHLSLLELVSLQEKQTASRREQAIHLFRLHETFTAPDE